MSTNAQNDIRKTASDLLRSGAVRLVIGWREAPVSGNAKTPDPAIPAFVTRPEDCSSLVWNDRCDLNLVTYLNRQEVRRYGRIAVCVKGCDARSLELLRRESQVAPKGEGFGDGAAEPGEGTLCVYAIGVACTGQRSTAAAAESNVETGKTLTSPYKCEVCDTCVPDAAVCDVVLGADEVTNPASDEVARYARLEEFMKLTPDERFAFWKEELSRCIRCYACRQICPLCYCNRCIADRNRPQEISSSPSLKGNVAWNITRAFHLAGRCVGCAQCSSACPMGIDLQLLNLTLARAAEDAFDGYRAGVTPLDPVIGTYSLEDKEEFIG